MTHAEVRAALAKCELTTKHIENIVEVLSVGEKAKIHLCEILNTETHLLILDEPTNHLDVDAKEELKRALKAYRESILSLSHEPDFYREIAIDI
ncbi:ATPase subunit of ABC transporter with duplicated ATPase domains [Metabacillus crassostreae]|nr:ATPase subunit of ABC transporter with duplicated ATPase domains [Metabacillus crassostreae]